MFKIKHAKDFFEHPQMGELIGIYGDGLPEDDTDHDTIRRVNWEALSRSKALAEETGKTPAEWTRMAALVVLQLQNVRPGDIIDE